MADGVVLVSPGRIENKESQRATSRRCARWLSGSGAGRSGRVKPERDKEKGHAPWANTD